MVKGGQIENFAACTIRESECEPQSEVTLKCLEHQRALGFHEHSDPDLRPYGELFLSQKCP